MGSEKKPLANVTEYWLQEHDPDTLLCWEKEIFVRLRKEKRCKSQRDDLQKDLKKSLPNEQEDLWNRFVHSCLGVEFNDVLDNDFSSAVLRLEKKKIGDKTILDELTIRLARAELLCRDVFPYVFDAESLACCLDHEAHELEWNGWANMESWYRESICEQALQETFEKLETELGSEMVAQTPEWCPPWENQGEPRSSWTEAKLARLHSGVSSGFLQFGEEAKLIMVGLLKMAFREYALLRQEIRIKSSGAAKAPLTSMLNQTSVADRDAFKTIQSLFGDRSVSPNLEGVVKNQPNTRGRRSFRILEQAHLFATQRHNGQLSVDGTPPPTGEQLAVRDGGAHFEAAKTAIWAFRAGHKSKTRRNRANLNNFLKKIRGLRQAEMQDGVAHPFKDKFSLAKIEEGLSAILRVKPDDFLAVEVDRLGDTVGNAALREAQKPD